MKRIFAILLIACLVVLPACSGQNSKDFFAMDTSMNITAYCSSGLINKAEKRIKEIDKNLSITSEKGEVYILNRDGALSNPSKELIEILNCAQTLYQRTGGAYDITTYAIKKLWQRCEDEGRIPTSDEINAALSAVGMSKITFDENKVDLGGVDGIDLGSLAKGYAGREAVELLKAENAKGGILTLGGNVATFGKKEDGSKYRVGIADPKNPEEICGYVEIEETNVVTSGGYNRYITIGDEKFSHIVDARTGMPCANGVAAVTVICEDGLWADALSTALLLLGEYGALEYYQIYGGFEAIIIMDDGRVVTTSDACGFIPT